MPTMPTFSGEVVIHQVVPGVTPSFDEDREVRPYSVDPIDNLPTFDHDAKVEIVKVDPPETSFDNDAEVRITTPSV